MKHNIGIFFRVCGYAVGYFLAVTAAYLIVSFIFNLFGIPKLSEVTGEFITDLAAFPIVVLLFQLYTPENRKKLFEGSISIRRLLFLVPISIIARILLLISIVVLLAVVMIVSGKDLTSLIDQGLAYQWEVFEKSNGIVKYLGFLSFVIFSPLNEELFNRGVVLNYLREYYSLRISIVYSSIIFMLLHLHPGLYLSSFILGLVLALVYVRFKNIWYSVVLHMLINLHPFIITYFLGPRQ